MLNYDIVDINSASRIKSILVCLIMKVRRDWFFHLIFLLILQADPQILAHKTRSDQPDNKKNVMDKGPSYVLPQTVQSMKKIKRGRGCICGNSRGIVENGYNGTRCEFLIKNYIRGLLRLICCWTTINYSIICP